ncbi:DIS3-like exonuclease 2 [Gastrolobium bilobum]|uniref:DIS3-like exonuclease 2 n=1 Tax=Gastrolobium bilobum TaxID=150636 RepID=UPI002AB2B72F|nr:DIS3-like exonuclease 2 [Gastrolobium bilobum]
MKASVEGSTPERFDDGEKDKKKKRRSNRRLKQNPPSSSASEVNETHGMSSECLGKIETPAHTTVSLSSSLKQQGLNVCSPNEQGLSKASNVAFISMPPMHIDEQVEPVDLQNMQIHGGGIGSRTFSEPIGCRGSSGTNKSKDSVPCSQIGHCPQRNYFSPHWSVEAIEKALEKGDVFKALFRVNAHNRLEAYCKIDGVPTDVLIAGIPAQNRAVEGDIVAIKIDPLSLWTKMKGSNGTSNNTAILEGCNLLKEDDEVGGNICKGKGKEDADHNSTPYRSYPCPEKRCVYEDNASKELASRDSIDGHHYAGSDFLKFNSRSGHKEVINAVEKMCVLVNSFPSKRPTGRVVAVIESSPRREGIVGHLTVKQWVSLRDISKEGAKNNKKLISEHEYIQLTPTDPKFPIMMLLVRELPKCIKKRLKSGDMTVEMDLVAAQIDDWSEESPFPEAHILHIFGQGGEVQSQLDAILFENAICLSDFSPEALSCLPCVPWEVPLKEMQSRINLRNLCIFTIDPSTATDLDDALSIEKLPNGNYRVGVHIADVSYFVAPDTALDSEAQFRSTSVYMLQRKLHMLPALFSENIGSLSPGVDRLAVSMLLDINLAGNVVDRWIGRTVIQSCCKLSYEHAQDIIDKAFDFEHADFIENGYPKVHGRFEWPDVITSLKSLYEISNVLKCKRFNDGALRLENHKAVIRFDENGIPYDIMLSERKESNFLVEEFMLLANTTAAEVICRAYPDGALLRRHPEPNMRKLREFMAFCQKHGLELDTSSSGQFHWSLDQIREKLKSDPVLYDILISYATRPMQLASYFCSGDLKDNEHEWGHYALAVPFYTHFTSPLRRYPDIVVHRTLLAVIEAEAEELYMKHQKALQACKEVELQKRCLTGIFDKNSAESIEVREALSAAALKHRVPCAEKLADIAAYCNERKLASRNVKDACDKLYMWFLLKKKEVLLSEARILGLGPKFMSIYVQKLAIERRIYYDDVEGMTVEWLESTSTLVLSMCTNRRAFRRGSSYKWRAFEEVALLTCPYNLKVPMDNSNQSDAMNVDDSISTMDREPISGSDTSKTEIEPAVFPLTVRLLSTIPVALHAVGGDDGPLDIGVRLYTSSYFG